MGEGAVKLGVEPVAGAQHRQRVVQSLESLGDAHEFAAPLALGPLAQSLGVAGLVFVIERLHEQARVLNEALTGGAVGTGVVGVPALQLARGQGVRAQGSEQRVRMLGVGARQRGEDAHRRPARESACAHRFEQLIRQRAEQLQAPVHPAHVTPGAPRQLVLGQPGVVGQLAQQQRLLQRCDGARLGGGQQAPERLGQRAVPQLYPHRIAAQAVQRRQAPIAIE